MIDRTALVLALADNGADSEKQSGHDVHESIRAARKISASTRTRSRTRSRTRTRARTRAKQRTRQNAVRWLATTTMLLALALALSTTTTRRLSRSTVRAFGTASISISRSVSRSILESGTMTPRIQHLATGRWSRITNHGGVLGMSSDSDSGSGSGSGSDSDGGKRKAPRADGPAAANANGLVRDVVESVLDTALEASATDAAAAASDSAAGTQAMPASVSRLLQSTLRRAYSTTSIRATAGEDLSSNSNSDNANVNTNANANANANSITIHNSNDDIAAAKTGNREKLGAFGTDANGNGLVRNVVESVLDTALEASATDAAAASSSTGSQVVSRLLESTLRRAYSTTAARASAGTETPPLSVINKGAAKDTMASDPVAQSTSTSASASYKPRFKQAIAYKDHPALNNVALAHALWASVVKPGVDTVIDTTCGNGNDSIVLAELLFGCGGDGDGPPQPLPQKQEQPQATLRPELVCLDVQELACERTAEALRRVLPSSVPVLVGDDSTVPSSSPSPSPSLHPEGHALVLNASHERLPELRDDSSVGLIVYNLGWLPGSSSSSSSNDNNSDNDNNTDDGKACVTTLDTTLSSLVDAVGLLRVGGMLSVITYPQTGPAEAAAVRLLVEALALRSSRTQTWEGALEEYASGASNGSGGSGGEEEDHPEEAASTIPEKRAIAAKVRAAMETVVARGPQTWRVSEHDRLGMDRPPILYTATRIK